MQHLSEQFTILANNELHEAAHELWNKMKAASVKPESLACDDALARLYLAKPADMAQRKLLGRDYVYAGIDY